MEGTKFLLGDPANPNWLVVLYIFGGGNGLTVTFLFALYILSWTATRGTCPTCPTTCPPPLPPMTGCGPDDISWWCWYTGMLMFVDNGSCKFEHPHFLFNKFLVYLQQYELLVVDIFRRNQLNWQYPLVRLKIHSEIAANKAVVFSWGFVLNNALLPLYPTDLLL